MGFDSLDSVVQEVVLNYGNLRVIFLKNAQWLAEKLDFLANYYVNEVTLRGQKPPLKCC